MYSRTLMRLSRQFLRYTQAQIPTQNRYKFVRRYADCCKGCKAGGQCTCGCKEGGECDCGPACDCQKDGSRLAARRRNPRDPPKDFDPKNMATDAFELRSNKDPKAFGPEKKGKKLDPSAEKNPEK